MPHIGVRPVNGPWQLALRLVKGLTGYGMIIIVLGLGMGSVYTMLQPAAQTNSFTFELPFFSGFWGVLGDFDLAVIEEATGAAHGADEVPVAQIALPIVLYAYMVFMTIIFVNLMIAQLSVDFEAFSPKKIYMLQTAHQILEAADYLPTFPPPLNVLYMLKSLSDLVVNLARCRLPKQRPRLVRAGSMMTSLLQTADLQEQESLYLKDFLREDSERQAEGVEHRLADLELEQRQQFDSLSARFDRLEKMEGNPSKQFDSQFESRFDRLENALGHLLNRGFPNRLPAMPPRPPPGRPPHQSCD